SVISRSPEEEIFPLLEKLGISVTAYGVLSRGLLSGTIPAAKSDYRAHLPRFSGDNFVHNQKLIAELKKIAEEKGITQSQLAVAWVLAKGRNIIPTMGARKRSQLSETLGALAVKLSPEDLKRIEAVVPPTAVAGTRYAEQQMKTLDSEKKAIHF
ncbi:MAG TPA: aldo/keto reductase, partial [bacterium]|nr:aldo/keto reductase [bacterium]